MKSCFRYRHSLNLYLYGDLDERRAAALAAHARSCPACGTVLKDLQAMKEMMTDDHERLSEPDWDRSWRKISTRLDAELSPRRRPLFRFRWAMAGATLAMVFVVGIYVGRLLFFAPPAQTTAPAMAYEARDFSDLVPLLTEFANRQQRPQGSLLISLDRDWAERLLFKYRLVRQRVKKGNDPELAQLLDDIELILLEISRVKPADAENVATIRELIRQKDISFKLRIYNKNPRLLRRM